MEQEKKSNAVNQLSFSYTYLLILEKDCQDSYCRYPLFHYLPSLCEGTYKMVRIIKVFFPGLDIDCLSSTMCEIREDYISKILKIFREGTRKCGLPYISKCI